ENLEAGVFDVASVDGAPVLEPGDLRRRDRDAEIVVGSDLAAIDGGLVLKRILEGDKLVALALQLLKYLVSLNHYILSTLPSLRAYVSFPAAFPQHFSVKKPNHIGGLV